jgi:hypothetical protein
MHILTIKIIAVSILLPTSFGFTFPRPVHRQSGVQALCVFQKNKKGNKSPNLKNFPRPDPANPDRFIAPNNFNSNDFYPPYISLLRNGPLPFFTRLTSPDKYQQAVFKYQFESGEQDLEEAQANMDAFFSSPDVWAEQKLREQRGEREVYRYAKPLDQERVALSLIWGSMVLFAIGKIVWKGILHF